MCCPPAFHICVSQTPRSVIVVLNAMCNTEFKNSAKSPLKMIRIHSAAQNPDQILFSAFNSLDIGHHQHKTGSSIGEKKKVTSFCALKVACDGGNGL